MACHAEKKGRRKEGLGKNGGCWLGTVSTKIVGYKNNFGTR